MWKISECSWTLYRRDCWWNNSYCGHPWVSRSCGALQGVLSSLQGSSAKAKWHKQEDNWHFCTVNTRLIKQKRLIKHLSLFYHPCIPDPPKSFYRTMKISLSAEERKSRVQVSQKQLELWEPSSFPAFFISCTVIHLRMNTNLKKSVVRENV